MSDKRELGPMCQTLKTPERACVMQHQGTDIQRRYMSDLTQSLISNLLHRIERHGRFHAESAFGTATARHPIEH